MVFCRVVGSLSRWCAVLLGVVVDTCVLPPRGEKMPFFYETPSSARGGLMCVVRASTYQNAGLASLSLVHGSTLFYNYY